MSMAGEWSTSEASTETSAKTCANKGSTNEAAIEASSNNTGVNTGSRAQIVAWVELSTSTLEDTLDGVLFLAKGSAWDTLMVGNNTRLEAALEWDTRSVATLEWNTRSVAALKWNARGIAALKWNARGISLIEDSGAFSVDYLSWETLAEDGLS